MATAYYMAAHFNVPSMHMNDVWTSIAAPRIPALPSLLQEGTQSHIQQHQTTTTQNHAQQHRTTAPSKRQPMASQTQSIFFRLPAELRNQIYQELLCPETPRPSQLHQYAQERHHPPQSAIYPSILLTCKRIHSEAQDLLYSTHIFHAHPSLLTSLPHLVSPLKPLLSPTAISKIRRWHISVRLDTDPQFTEAQATKAFSGAEYLEIQAWQSMFDGCDDSVLRLFRGVRGVKVARVTGCVEEGVARWLESSMVLPIEEKMGEGVCGGCSRKVDNEERKMEWRQREGGLWTLGGNIMGDLVQEVV